MKRLVCNFLRALALFLNATADLICAPGHEHEAVSLTFKVGPITEQQLTFERRSSMITLKATQKVLFELEAKDAKGNPAQLDGVPQWSLSNPGVAHLDVAPDGMSATVVADFGGTTQVAASADADLGEGVRTISCVDDVTVLPAEAVSLGFKVGTPQDQ